ncbi:MAG TPA: cell division protein FtsQ/DivIB [Burkholderiales bacterium]|nr:cell division protein FtsQ/DivIB [Burkholderiales bacterium]
MWGNARLLNMAAGFFVGIALLIFVIVGLTLLWRSAAFPVKRIQIKASLKNTAYEEVEAAARARISGNFFALSPAEVRAGVERLPWVRRASVRRVWPDQIDIALEEHVALARWGDDALVNTFGERFAAQSDLALPTFLAPSGSEREVARRYARFMAVAAPLESPVERVVLTARYAWQLRLANGLTLMLGRDADLAEDRLRRFVEVYPVTLKTIQKKHEYVDLRYPNGFALRVPELPG